MRGLAHHIDQAWMTSVTRAIQGNLDRGFVRAAHELRAKVHELLKRTVAARTYLQPGARHSARHPG